MVLINFKEKYFLAANSLDGFVSNFSDNFSIEWNVYIIKGGPGTGKSSFMKYIAKIGEDKGFKTEYVHCSSDPNSLDGVVFPKIKTVIFDGTAPHTLEPKYPGAVETTLDFSRFWDSEKLKMNKREIIAVTNENKQLHKTVSNYLKVSGELLKQNIGFENLATDLTKVDKFSEKLVNKYIKERGKGAGEEIRYLTGITPKGIITYTDSIDKICENLVIIRDEFGFITDLIMNKIRNKAIEKNYKIITVKNALLPSLTDHIIIPEISLAFARESNFWQFKNDVRRIHAARFIEKPKLNKNKEKMKFNKRVINELLNSGITTLKAAKEKHDILESYYIKAMDFGALTEYANNISNKIFEGL